MEKLSITIDRCLNKLTFYGYLIVYPSMIVLMIYHSVQSQFMIMGIVALCLLLLYIAFFNTIKDRYLKDQKSLRAGL